MPKRITQQEFVTKATEVHNGVYTYLKAVYANNRTPVTITCKVHGDFKQSPDSHFRGRGCPACRSANIPTWRAKSLLSTIEEACKVHNNKYMYSICQDYKTQQDILTIKCPRHGVFTQKARDHLDGCGCQDCGNLARNKLFRNEPTILYYLYFPSLNVWKIGITMARYGVAKRYSSEAIAYEVISTVTYRDGLDAYRKEQQILKQHRAARYTGAKLFKLGGETECFKHDIFKDKLNE